MVLAVNCVPPPPLLGTKYNVFPPLPFEVPPKSNARAQVEIVVTSTQVSNVTLVSACERVSEGSHAAPLPSRTNLFPEIIAVPCRIPSLPLTESIAAVSPSLKL